MTINGFFKINPDIYGHLYLVLALLKLLDNIFLNYIPLPELWF